MYKYLFFDLDGTIVEPSKGIVNSILYALDKLEEKDVNPNDLLKFIGPPLEYSFMNFLGFSEQKADEAVRLYREYYDKYWDLLRKIQDKYGYNWDRK